MRDSGKVNKNCQLPISRIFSLESTPEEFLGSWFSGKDARPREKLISLINSRDFSYQVPESSNYSQYCPQRVFSVRIGVSRIFPGFGHSRIFSPVSTPETMMFPEKIVLFHFVCNFFYFKRNNTIFSGNIIVSGVDTGEKMREWPNSGENTRDSNSHRENSLRMIPGVIGTLGYLMWDVSGVD
jgi:hypothetical protein